MKVPLNWLKEYVDLPPKSKDLAELLTMSGTAVEGISRKGNSEVFEIEVTTNRPDCLSLRGIAREVSALTGKKIKKPPLRELKVSSKDRLPLRIDIEDKKGCPRYLGRVFTNASVSASPSWLSRHLESMGQKTINNVADITNFCLFELGQPLHAFDYDKLKGQRIIVRRARKGEKIIGINGTEYSLDERILVIADAERPVAIAGIMGGQNSEVGPSTKRVLLESAQFDPVLIRRAIRMLKLSSESSYRFERSVDPTKVEEASNRAGGLFSKIVGAKAASPLIEAGSWKAPKGARIRLRLPRVEETLGISVKPEKATKILSDLGFKVKKASRKELKVKTLVERSDIKQEVDLIEEIVRVYGYNRIPDTLPQTHYDRNVLIENYDREYRQIRRLKEFLAAQGMVEAVTFSSFP